MRRRTLPIARDPFRLALVGFLILSLSRVHAYLGPVARIRPALLLVLLALGYAVLNPGVVKWGTLLRTWPAKVIVGLGVMACLSVPFSISLGGSAMFIISEYSKVLVFALLLILALRDARDLKLFTWAYVVACGILVAIALTIDPISKSSGMSTYDANDVGLVLMTGFPLALLAYQTSGRRGRIVALLVMVGIGVTMARSGSRGTFVGFVVAALALLFMLREVAVWKRFTFLGVVLMALVMTAPSGYWSSMSTLLSPTEDYNWTSDTGRKAVWTRGLGYMLRNPVTGVGVGQFGRAEGTISELARTAPEERGIKWSSPHNSYLEAGAEMGIPGLLLWSSLVFGGIGAMLGMRRRLPSWWIRGDPEERFLFRLTLFLPVALIAFGATSFFLSFAYADPVYVLAALVAGSYAAVASKMRRGPSGPHPSPAPAQVPYRRRLVGGAPNPPLARRPSRRR